ncbi:MAG: FmdB family zinc ribbon protein [Candidatus Gracilibacteria bacterium]
MTIYNFKCTECNHQFEHLALPPVKEELAIACPSCDSESVKKLLAPATPESEIDKKTSPEIK